MLTAKQQRFVEEYLVDFNGAGAYVRAGYSARGNSAEAAASRLLRNGKVQAAIAAGQKALSERTEITQEMVLQRWWDIATADPNELVQFRRTSCRYCHGEDHQFQWIDQQEFAVALAAAVRDENSDPRNLPQEAGGFGYNPSKPPVASCPQCFGEGHGQIHGQDSRFLKGSARLLYAGVKQTQGGWEIKMHDQGKALESVARHLGMYRDKLELEVTENLADVLAAARERAIASRS